ncbi:MAG: DF family (seleno)protein [Bellilinea sp.]|jgi:hypothetical protein
MKIELLYFAGCPSWEQGLKNLQAALADEHLDAEIDLLLIENDEMADKQRFLGSPSFRIDGQDLWPEVRDSYHFGCRIYATEKGFAGAPTTAMLRSKIRSMT